MILWELGKRVGEKSFQDPGEGMRAQLVGKSGATAGQSQSSGRIMALRGS